MQEGREMKELPTLVEP